jgi:hypothetical protein
MKRKIVKVMCGLPASGKTTFAKNIYSKENIYDVYCDFDRKMKFKESFKGTDDEYFRYLLNGIDDTYLETIILDGLFVNNRQYEIIVNRFAKRADIEFHFWKENRAICLYNDLNRREENSEITIKHLPLEEPNLDV